MTNFAENFPLMKNWKASSEIDVNNAVKLQICKSTLKLYVSEELLCKKSTNSIIFFLDQFSWSPKNYISTNIYFCKSGKIIYFAYVSMSIKQNRKTLYK